jgi:hypothetical protein
MSAYQGEDMGEGGVDSNFNAQFHSFIGPLGSSQVQPCVEMRPPEVSSPYDQSTQYHHQEDAWHFSLIPPLGYGNLEQTYSHYNPSISAFQTSVSNR